MEGSINNSCMNQVAAQSFQGRTIDYDEVPQEESGWTAYFDDLAYSNNRQHSAAYSSSSGFDSPSLVSDAASCAPWKFADGHVIAHPSSSKLRLLNKKKKKTKGGVLEEDALEDTASSPVNSPKVSSMKQYHHVMTSRKNDDDNIEYSSTSDQLRKGSMADHFKELQTDERNQLGMMGRENNDFTDLKKKGLCLVPMSMFVNLG